MFSVSHYDSRPLDVEVIQAILEWSPLTQTLNFVGEMRYQMSLLQDVSTRSEKFAGEVGSRALPGAGTRPRGFPRSEGEALGTAVWGVRAPGGRGAGREGERRGQRVCPEPAGPA